MTDFHFVIVGTVKCESREVALEMLKKIINKNEEIKDISELTIFGKTLQTKKSKIISMALKLNGYNIEINKSYS